MSFHFFFSYFNSESVSPDATASLGQHMSRLTLRDRVNRDPAECDRNDRPKIIVDQRLSARLRGDYHNSSNYATETSDDEFAAPVASEEYAKPTFAFFYFSLEAFSSARVVLRNGTNFIIRSRFDALFSA